jgi:hypothetical protein
MDIVKNFYLRMLDIFGIVHFTFITHSSFNEDNFIKSLHIVSDKINIKLNIINDKKTLFIKKDEIYFYLNETEMDLYCSHKFYDASSVFYILSIIDKEYNENIPTVNIIHQTKTITKTNVDSFFLLRNNLFLNIFKNIEKPSGLFKDPSGLFKDPSGLFKDPSGLFKEYTFNKSIDIIDDIQNMCPEYNLIIIINTRKMYNLSETTIGNYINALFLEKDNKDFIKLLKNTTIDNLDESSKNQSVLDKNIIFNSYLKYKLPSFLHEMNNYVGIDCAIPLIFVTPKNSEGVSKAYFNNI